MVSGDSSVLEEALLRHQVPQQDLCQGCPCFLPVITCQRAIVTPASWACDLRSARLRLTFCASCFTVRCRVMVVAAYDESSPGLQKGEKELSVYIYIYDIYVCSCIYGDR